MYPVSASHNLSSSGRSRLGSGEAHLRRSSFPGREGSVETTPEEHSPPPNFCKMRLGQESGTGGGRRGCGVGETSLGRDGRCPM